MNCRTTRTQNALSNNLRWFFLQSVLGVYAPRVILEAIAVSVPLLAVGHLANVRLLVVIRRLLILYRFWRIHEPARGKAIRMSPEKH